MAGTPNTSFDLTNDAKHKSTTSFQFVDCNPLQHDSQRYKVLKPFTSTPKRINLVKPMISPIKMETTTPTLQLSREKCDTLQKIQDLQKDNPNIEAIFIDDSDMGFDGEKRQTIKIHNNIVLSPPNHNLVIHPSVASSAQTVSPMAVATTTANNIIFTKPPPLSVATPSISGSMLLKPQQQRVIKLSPELLAFVSGIKGPVLFNIPGVGPVLINKTSPSGTDASNPTSASNPAGIPPFSLNFQDILKKQMQQQQLHQLQQIQRQMLVNNKPVAPTPPKKPAYDPLWDKKFCWFQMQKRKVYIDGFTLHERQGFTKTELSRIRGCDYESHRYLTELRKRLLATRTKYHEFLMERKATNEIALSKIKLVEIDDIKRRCISPSTLTPIVQMECDENSNESNNDLLLTKKVVILNKRGRRRRNTKLRRLPKNTHSKVMKKTKSDDFYMKKFNLKPCCVEMERSSFVESMCKQNPVTTVKHVKPIKPVKPMKPVKPTSPLKPATPLESATPLKSAKPLKHGRPSKSATPLKSATPAKPVSNKSNKDKYIEAISKIFDERIIKTLDHFNKLMLVNKPLLMIDENHLKMNFALRSLNHNLVFNVIPNQPYPLPLIRNERFLNAVELGHVRLVACSVLSQFYAAGGHFGASSAEK